MVKLVDGKLENGRWFDKNKINSIDTYENVKKNIKICIQTSKCLGYIKTIII
ncbi:MAG: hypothetical protein RXQ71_05260 [Caldisphaera sp.]|uniref:hypothetical protein n=1 Tax=Caldisphaera sp. TaxID=2060322 RepID=UPI00397C123D